MTSPKETTKSEEPSIHELHKLKLEFPVGPDYSLQKQIGKGSYGTVVLAKHLPTSKMVAIKKLDEVFLYVKDAKRILREIILLRELNNHRNMIRLYDIIVTEDPKTFSTLYLVFEHAASDIRKVYRSKYFLTERHI